MTKRARIIAYGGAGLLVVAGAAVAVVITGGAGQVIAMVLIGVGLVAALSLVFYEVGLSEDRQREREEDARRERRRPDGATRGRPVGRPAPDGRAKPRLERSRGTRRRLHRDDR